MTNDQPAMSRREAREARDAASQPAEDTTDVLAATSDGDESHDTVALKTEADAAEPTVGAVSEADAKKAKKRRRRRRGWWIFGISFVLLVAIALGGAYVAKRLYDQAIAARSSLEQAIPLASEVANEMIAGDNVAAQETLGQITELTAEAKRQASGKLWEFTEGLPWIGPNLTAVQTLTEVADDLVHDALAPATTISLDVLKPVDGALDPAAFVNLKGIVDTASGAIDTASARLNEIDREPLIDQVKSGLDRVTGSFDELKPALTTASQVLAVVPAALGADAPRNYLMIFQNNAESRGTGGNPAALILLRVDNGRVSIEEQASSSNFRNARPEPVTPLNPETEALYGDKVGRWIPDATMTPSFNETANIMRAWWAEEFDTPIDAVISFDPVALSYVLAATGPVTVPATSAPIAGRGVLQVIEQPFELTSANSVSFLLNQVYFDYDFGYLQDVVFATSARAIFDAVTTGAANPKSLLEAVLRAVAEGRLMYQPATESEQDLIAGTLLAGELPTSNTEQTTVGVYVNDNTTSKLDYYMKLDVAATSTQCQSPEAPTFSVTSTFTNTLTPEQAADLPYSVAPAVFFPKGDVSTYMLVYGPVGATAADVLVDGASATDVKVLPHLGRPAVKVLILNHPGETHTVSVTFTGGPGDYGPLNVRNTPMVMPVGVDASAPGCASE